MSTRRRLAWLLLLGCSSLATGSLESARYVRAGAPARDSQGTAAPRRAASPPRALPRKVEFPLGKTEERDLPSDTIHAYGIDLKRGQALRVTFDQRGIDIAVTAFDPSGRRIVLADGLAASLGPERLVLVAADSGRFRLEVSGLEAAGSESRYLISDWSVGSGTERDRSCMRASQEYQSGNSKRKDDPGAAVARFSQAGKSWRACGWTLGGADAAFKESAVRGELKDFRGKAESALAASELYRRAGDGASEALALSHLAAAKEWLEEDEIAKSYYQASIDRAVAASRELQKRGLRAGLRLRTVRRTELTGRLQIGMLMAADSDLPGAFSALNRARDLARELGDKTKEAQVAASLGVAYAQWGDFDLAFELERSAKGILARSEDDQLWKIRIRQTLAHIYVQVGLPERAVGIYQDLLSSSDPPLGDADRALVFSNLSLALYRLRRFEEGLATAERARKAYAERRDGLGEATVLANEGWFLIRLQRYDEARQVLRETGAGGAMPEGSLAEGGRLFALAELERSQGNLEAAHVLAVRVVTLLDRRAALVSDPKARALQRAALGDPYDFWIELLMQRDAREPRGGWGLRGFAEVDRLQGRGIRESLARKAGVKPAPDDLSVPEAAAALRRGLDRESVLLRYHLAESEGYLWIATSDAMRTVRLPGREQLAPKVQALHRALANGDQIGSRELARREAEELVQILVQPALRELEGKKRILIGVPPDLEYIPFAVLPLPSGLRLTSPPGPAGEWPASLSSRFEVVSVPSLSAIAVARTAASARRTAPRLLAVFDDPVTDPKDPRLGGSGHPDAKRGSDGDDPTRGAWGRLDHAAAEASAVVDLVGEGRAVRFTAFEARRDLVSKSRLRDFRYLHFITHGVWNRARAGGTSLVLSLFDRRGRPIDGFLSASDIEKLDLRSELVVLSACSSGLGREVWGAGLDGLSQAFLKAGAERVVVSLWNVNDEATAELMRRFYGGIFERRLPPAQALREAQESLRRETRWASPYYWGGFVLKGDWQ